MKFDPPLLLGRLEQRYKRFLADVTLPGGELVVAHCPNTGAMTGCKDEGSRVWLSPSDNPKRKLKYTWQLVETAAGDIACIHSALANKVVEEALDQGVIKELAGFEVLKREVRLASGSSRMDFKLTYPTEQAWVEVKSVTLLDADGVGLFPDAVSKRGSKHLRELIAIKEGGDRAVLVFAVLHSGISEVRPADGIDAEYGETLREALAAGVEVLAYGAEISPEGMSLVRALPVIPRQ